MNTPYYLNKKYYYIRSALLHDSYNLILLSILLKQISTYYIMTLSTSSLVSYSVV